MLSRADRVVADPTPQRLTLRTADGVSLDAAYDEPRGGGRDLAVVLAHGFTGSWSSPGMRAVVRGLRPWAGLVSFDFRGHGRSGGLSTVGDLETLDLDAAVAHARALGYARVVTCGWSMGASVVVRHAALHRGVDAVVAVSGPSRWYIRDTAPMRRVHWVIEKRTGRVLGRTMLGTRISGRGWDPVPLSPIEVVARIAPTPLLVVHGDRDAYFDVSHAQALYDAAAEPKELWLVPGFGHAENAATPELLDRLGRHLVALVAPGGPVHGTIPS